MNGRRDEREQIAKALAQGVIDGDPDAIEIMDLIGRPKTAVNAKTIARWVTKFVKENPEEPSQ